MVQGMADWPARMKQMVEFVGLTQAELALVKSTAPLLLKHADELTSAVYDHFLKFPDTRKFFLTEDAEVDQERLERRKHGLARWLQRPLTSRLMRTFRCPCWPLRWCTAIRPLIGSIWARYPVGS